MSITAIALRAMAAGCLLAPTTVSALDLSVPAIHGDISRLVLGDGTGVIVGVVDSGVDDTHPALAGFDSQGLPRLVAEANFVASEPGNTGDDVHGHGTWIASVIGSSDATHTGLAPDSRYINARVLDNNNGFPSDVQVRNGLGFAIDNGADVVNLSLNYFATTSGGNTQLEYMIDWAADKQGVVCAICTGNIGQGNGATTVRGPGSAYNGITVGKTDGRFLRVDNDSATSYTQNGRMKPDVVAPGVSITMANDDWETQSDFNTASGCSFATPHVAGLIAQQIEAGRRHGLSVDPKVIRATVLNSASKQVLDKQGQAWATDGVTRPLDPDSGAGQVDGANLATQYLAREQSPGIVAAVGWDLSEAVGGASVDYTFDAPLVLGSHLTATLAWSRHIGRIDRGRVGVDASDSFFLEEALDNLDLQLLADGVLVAESRSQLDNIEHLFTPITAAATYTLRVVGTSITGASLSEAFAIAWSAVAVPEPASSILVAFGLFAALPLTGRRVVRG